MPTLEITTKIKQMYRAQRAHAKERGIDFLLTFEQWFLIWENSGHLHERGKRKGQYVMARFKDKGPYAIDNVKIITSVENSQERMCSVETSNKHRVAKIGNNFALKITAKQARRIRAEYEFGVRGRGYASLARKYDVCFHTIRNVVQERHKY